MNSLFVLLYNNFSFQIKEAKGRCFRNVYAKDADAELDRLRTAHLNDDEETEVDKSDLVDGILQKYIC